MLSEFKAEIYAEIDKERRKTDQKFEDLRDDFVGQFKQIEDRLDKIEDRLDKIEDILKEVLRRLPE